MCLLVSEPVPCTHSRLPLSNARKHAALLLSRAAQIIPIRELIQFLGAFDSKMPHFEVVPPQIRDTLQKGNMDLSSSNPSPALCELYCVLETLHQGIALAHPVTTEMPRKRRCSPVGKGGRRGPSKQPHRGLEARAEP